MFFCELDAPELTALLTDGTVIAQLAALGAQISLGLRDLSAARAAAVRRLSAAGIPVITWQLLPAEQGYWYNLSNSHHAAARYAAFQAWTRARPKLGRGWDRHRAGYPRGCPLLRQPAALSHQHFLLVCFV